LEKDYKALKIILGSSALLVKLALGASSRSVIRGQASRTKLTLRCFLHSAFMWSAEPSCSCEAELRGEANARLASLRERNYALAKLFFLS